MPLKLTQRKGLQATNPQLLVSDEEVRATWTNYSPTFEGNDTVNLQLLKVCE
jgi:hypothetical protein